METEKPLTHAEKTEGVRALLAEFDSVLVFVNCLAPNVVLPDDVKARKITVLELGLDMPLPIPDLVVSPIGITATLSFARSPFAVCVPWDAVLAARPKDETRRRSPAPAVRKLVAVPMDAPFDEALAAPSAPANAVQARPTLRLVKG